MTDNPETLAKYRLPLSRGQLKQAGAMTPMLRYVPKNPLFLIGAAIVGVAGVLAWRNREKIAQKAGPMIEDAKAKGEDLIETAKAKGGDLIDTAKAKGEALIDSAKATTEAVAAKARRTRRTAAAETGPPELH